MSDRHEWTDEKTRLPMAAVAAFVDVEPGVNASFDSLWTKFPASGWTSDGAQAAAREILRLAARVKELHDGHLVIREEMSAIEDALPALPEADQDQPLADRVRLAILYAQAGNEYGVPLLEARIAILAAVVAPLLPLFRERFEAWERVQGRGITGSPEFPKTVTLTAEFPVEALRALTKE